MERLSSTLFMLALILYYVPKALKVKKKKYLKLHIVIGGISIIAMVLALVERIGQPDFIKYVGFTIIMILIGVSGYLIKKNPKLYRKLHTVFTIVFFVYLFTTIVIF
ncbi:hypothetical protein [uncultured Clostridium sp.]|uniref:hypothetical protein n=1 Tax=uncultured Clostridium sp. TaxID=59620 RepID=UPI0025D049DD|nr:hypothetical protein [uncultured Clostridium sp.]